MSNQTGSELRALREEADVLAKDVGARMNVHSSRVSQIEALAEVTPRTARRYLAALEACQLAKTSDALAPAPTS